MSAKEMTETIDLADETAPAARQPQRIVFQTDGESCVIEARGRLRLRCGKASITLEADGTIVLHGTQIVSHADGVNRIRGGAIHLN